MAEERNRVLTITRGATVLETARKLLLAGIGAVVLAQEEIEIVIERLVERGEIAERDGRQLLKEILNLSGSSKLTGVRHLRTSVNSDAVPGEATLASVEQVNQLGEKIEVISARIDHLIEEHRSVTLPDNKEFH